MLCPGRILQPRESLVESVLVPEILLRGGVRIVGEEVWGANDLPLITERSSQVLSFREL